MIWLWVPVGLVLYFAFACAVGKWLARSSKDLPEASK